MAGATGDFSEDDLRTALLTYGGAACKAVADEPKLFKATFDTAKGAWRGLSPMMRDGVKAGLKEVGKRPAELPAALASLYSQSIKDTAASKGHQQAARATSFVLSQAKATAGYAEIMARHLAGKTTLTGVLVFATATTVQKTGLAVSLAGGDGEKAKCVGAAMELAGTVGTTAVLGLGSGGVMIALTAMSIVAQSIYTYDACF